MKQGSPAACCVVNVCCHAVYNFENYVQPFLTGVNLHLNNGIDFLKGATLLRFMLAFAGTVYWTSRSFTKTLYCSKPTVSIWESIAVFHKVTETVKTMTTQPISLTPQHILVSCCQVIHIAK